MSQNESCSDLEKKLGSDTQHGNGGTINPEFERATVRKVDRRLLIILGALYSISLMDRANLGSARVAGMGADLGLTVGNRYSVVSLVFFVPYIIFELPSNILLRKVGARNLLATISILWGGVVLAMGFVTTWQQLAGLRVLLGLLEGGFFPGCIFLIQTWYTRYETQKRMASFYLVGMVVIGFSSIFSYGFSKLDGVHGIAGWSWIFIIMGAITIGVGIIAFFLIVDFPDKSKFLTAEETALVMGRLNRDRGDASPDELSIAKILKHFSDPCVWAFGLLFACGTLTGTAFSVFLAVILAGAGYSTVLSLCLSAPPWIAAALYTFGMAFFADKTRKRGIFIAANAVLSIVGLVIISYGNKAGVRYFGSFLALMPAQANVPGIIAYSANNVVSHSKRAVTSAVVIGMGGVGGIVASTVYREKDYPRYIPGLWVTIGGQFVALAILGVLTWHFKTQNKKADEGKRGPIEGQEGFRYTI